MSLSNNTNSQKMKLSANQQNFLEQCGFIRLSEWRLFGQNSSRVLNPTGDGSCPPKWFYVGSPPYTLHPSNNNPMEKPWPHPFAARAAALSGQTVEENRADAERLLFLALGHAALKN
jgi:hypothetical protein